MTLDHIPSNIGLLAFAASSIVYLLNSRAESNPKLALGGFVLFIMGTVGASLAMIFPLLHNHWDFASGLLLVSCLGWISIVAHFRFRLISLGTFVAPLATLILMVQFFMTDHSPGESTGAFSGALINAHVTLAILGEAFAICACAIAIIYLTKQNLLKKKLLNQLSDSGPTLNNLDRMLMFTLWAGFIFLTLGLLSGAIYTRVYHPQLSSQMEVKVLWAIAVWLWYLTILLARNIFNRSGKRIGQLSVGGFLLLAVSYFGILFSQPMAGV